MIDHKYGTASTRKEIEERNGRKISVKIKKQECLRCGKTKEDRIRTIIEPGDEQDNDGEIDTDTQENDSSNVEKIYSKSKPTKKKNISSTNDEGVVILKGNKNKKSESKPQKTQNKIRVNCMDCDYTSCETQNHQRSGDFCPECGSWLEEV